MSNVNPYAPSVSYPVEQTSELKIAGQTQRFLTSIIDNLVIFVLNYGLGIAIGLLIFASGGVTEQSLAVVQVVATLAGWILALLYYSILEGTTGLTLGKLVMGTKVLDKDGNRATFTQCVGRSACRFIPFEAFSFLIGTNSHYPIGWHDRFAGTVVVSTRR